MSQSSHHSTAFIMRFCFLLALCFVFYQSADAGCRDVLPSCLGLKHSVRLSDGCNTWFCPAFSKSKVAACTRMLCMRRTKDLKHCADAKEENLKRIANAKQRVACGFKVSCEGVKRKVVFSDGCNICRCNPGQAAAACGRMRCPKPESGQRSFCSKVKSEATRRITSARK